MISPPLLDNAAVLYQPGVYPGAWLDENGEAVLDESGEPILLGPDNYGDIEPPLIGDGPTLLAPVLTVGPVSLLAPLLGEPILYTPLVSTGGALLQPPLVGDGSAVYAPTVAPAASLQPPIIESGPATYAPALTVGSVALSAPVIGDGAALLAPTISGGQSTVIVSATIGLARGTMTIGCVPRSQTWS